MNKLQEVQKLEELEELKRLHIISHNQEEIKNSMKYLNKAEAVTQFTTRLSRAIRNINNYTIFKISNNSNNSNISNNEYLFTLKNDNEENEYIYKNKNILYVFKTNNYSVKMSLYSLIVTTNVYEENIDKFNEKMIEVYNETKGMFVSKKCSEEYSKIRNNLGEYFYKIEDETKFIEYFENKFKQKLFQEKNKISIMSFDEYTTNKNKQKEKQINNPISNSNVKNQNVIQTNQINQTEKVQKTKQSKSNKEVLFTREEISKLPLELQVSYQEAQDLYNKNKNFLDQNDKTLIKAFKRGKIWSAGYYGPSGTGKTTKLIAIAGALGLPYLKVTGSRNIDEAYLFGKYVLKNGSTVFEYGPLTKIMKYGGVFIFDEINMIDGDVLSSLNDLLDGSRMKVLDSGEVIKAHPNFRFAESMNIGYAGTNEMNISHKSRIQFKNKLSEISTETMAKIVINETGIEEKIALEMSSLVPIFNDIIENLGDATSQRIDIRHIINWANLTIDLDNDILSAAILTVISSLTEEDDEVGNTTKEYLETSKGIGSEIYKVIKTTFQD